MSRARVARRAWHRRIVNDLASDGVAERAVEVNKVLHPVTGSPWFWKMVRDRVGAREMFRPIRSLDDVRAIAMQALAELAVDVTGLQLKVHWHPPQLTFTAVPSAERAIAAATRTGPAEAR